MKILVIGGTGFLGTATARKLAEVGHKITVANRHWIPGVKRLPGIDYMIANVTSSEELNEVMQGQEIIINLVAIIRQHGKQTFTAVNRHGTEKIVGAAQKAGIRHFIHVSALGVDPDPEFPYLASKWAGEQALMGSELPYTILRPSLIYGPGDKFFTVLTRLIRLNPIVPIAGDGSTMFQPIAKRDVVKIIEMAIERGSQNKVYEIGGPNYLSYAEIITTIKNEIGSRKRTVKVPIPLMMPVAFLMDKLLSNPPVTPDQLKMLQKNNLTRLDVVQKTWGFAPLAFVKNCDYLLNY